MNWTIKRIRALLKKARITHPEVRRHDNTGGDINYQVRVLSMDQEVFANCSDECGRVPQASHVAEVFAAAPGIIEWLITEVAIHSQQADNLGEAWNVAERERDIWKELALRAACGCTTKDCGHHGAYHPGHATMFLKAQKKDQEKGTT